MNEFEGLSKILQGWQEVNRLMKLNQELYELLSGSLHYLIRYAEKNNIELPNKVALYEMMNRIHSTIETIPPPQDEQPNRNNRRRNNTRPIVAIASGPIRTTELPLLLLLRILTCTCLVTNHWKAPSKQ